MDPQNAQFNTFSSPHNRIKYNSYATRKTAGKLAIHKAMLQEKDTRTVHMMRHMIHMVESRCKFCQYGLVLAGVKWTYCPKSENK